MTDAGQADNAGNDAQLLRQVAQGEIAALELLFTRYQRQVYQLVFGITRNAETAEEILQDTFFRLYTHASELDMSLPLLPWLYRVAANLAYNQSRRRSLWSEPLHQLAERLSVPSPRQPEHIAEQHELQAIVHAMLDELPPNHRAVLVLHYIEDYSVPEIAAILDCPEGTVKSRLHHARKLLRGHLQRCYGRFAWLPDLG